jgi:hypothetical protein
MLFPADEAKRFQSIYPQLLFFAVEQAARPKDRVRLLDEFRRNRSEAAVEARTLLFDESDILQEFVKKNPGDLEPRELAVVRSWRNFRKGQFFVERALKEYAVFIGSKPSAACGVLGLVSEIEEMLGYRFSLWSRRCFCRGVTRSSTMVTWRPMPLRSAPGSEGR